MFDMFTYSASSTSRYLWGLDLSGTPQGAGRLLAVIPGAQGFSPAYYPCYDANGNVTEYVDGAGTAVAHYGYDAFGGSAAKPGLMADAFPYRFSTKCLDDIVTPRRLALGTDPPPLLLRRALLQPQPQGLALPRPRRRARRPEPLRLLRQRPY